MSKKRPSLSKGEASPGLTERPLNAMVSVEGGNTLAALTSPGRKSSLKKTFTRDSSTPTIDATATARRSQPAPLLQALSTGDAAKSRRDSSEFTAASPAGARGRGVGLGGLGKTRVGLAKSMIFLA